MALTAYDLRDLVIAAVVARTPTVAADPPSAFHELDLTRVQRDGDGFLQITSDDDRGFLVTFTGTETTVGPSDNVERRVQRRLLLTVFYLDPTRDNKAAKALERRAEADAVDICNAIDVWARGYTDPAFCLAEAEPGPLQSSGNGSAYRTFTVLLDFFRTAA